MIKNLDRTKRHVAVLSSQSSRIYSDSPVYMSTYYDAYQAYEFYILLNMIHIPADIVFDETIINYGLDDYDVLVLPKCDTLLKSIYDKVIAFQKRGGLVIADQYLRAPVPNVIKIDFDFTHRAKVSADALMGEKVFGGGGDTLESRTQQMKQVEGVTALDDQRLMEDYAAKLQKELGDRIHKDIDCNSPTALLNILEKNDEKYLFVINDKRAYGERLGQYKAMLEKVVPQTVTITVNNACGRELYFYDMPAHRQITAERNGQNYVFDINLPAPGGTIVAILTQKPEKIDVIVQNKLHFGSNPIDVLVRDTAGNLLRGVQPLQVTILDPTGAASEFTDYYASIDGRLTIPFVSAKNDAEGKWTVKVQELMSGLTASGSFELCR
jgi:hypothetical protein